MHHLIGQLYEIERESRGDPEVLLHRRKTEGKVIVDKIQKWVFEQSALPSSSLGRAIDYLKKYWVGLCRFMEDPEIELDNNRSERALRGVVLGRKNSLGSHSPKGAETSAVLYSICESAKLNGIDPRVFLRYAVSAQLQGNRALTPSQFIQSREAAA